MDFTLLRKISEGSCAEVFLVQINNNNNNTNNKKQQQQEEDNPTSHTLNHNPTESPYPSRRQNPLIINDGIAVLKCAKPGYESPAMVEAVEMRRISLKGAHPYIVSVLGFYEKENGIARGLLLEYCRGGSLGDYLKERNNNNNNNNNRKSTPVHATAPPESDDDDDTHSNNNNNRNTSTFIHNSIKEDNLSCIPISHVRRLFSQLLDALIFLEDMQLWHRDLKPDNILLTSPNIEEASIKLSDFGFARRTPHSKIKHGRSGAAGSPAFMSPERLDQFAFSTLGIIYNNNNNNNNNNINNETTMSYSRSKAEVWSAGLILYFMIFGRYPFGKVQSLEELSEKQKNMHIILQSETYLIKPENGSLLNLLQIMLEFDPLKRVELLQARNHPWLQVDIENKLVLPTSANNISCRTSFSPPSRLRSLTKDNLNILSNSKGYKNNLSEFDEETKLYLFLSEFESEKGKNEEIKESFSKSMIDSSYIVLSTSSKSHISDQANNSINTNNNSVIAKPINSIDILSKVGLNVLTIASWIFNRVLSWFTG